MAAAGADDFLARANGEVLPWVDLDEGESVCAHQEPLPWNLSRPVLRVLQLVDSLGCGWPSRWSASD